MKMWESKPEFGYKRGWVLVISLALIISVLTASRGGAFNPQRFYIYFSQAMLWGSLLIFLQARKKMRSSLKNHFWLSDEEIEFVEKTYGDGRPLDEYYVVLPLARRRLTATSYGLVGALGLAGLAWALTAAASRLFLSEPLQDVLVSVTGVMVYRGVVTATLANLAALSVGLTFYKKYRNRADRSLPVPPRVTLENLRDYQGRSNL